MSYCSILGDAEVETYLGCTICYTTRMVGGKYYSNCVEVYHSDLADAKKDICEQQDGVWDGATCDLEITPYWKYNTTYREIDIEVWYPYGTPYRAYFGGAYHEESTRPLLKAAIDAYLGPEPGPYTSVIDFVVPAALPAGSTVSVSVLLKNTGGTAGRLDVNIIGNPSEEEEYTQVGAGAALSVEPGASVWRDITCFNMPEWGYLLTAENYDATSSISKTISLGAVPPPPADFGFVSATTDKPSYDVGETVWIAFVAGNVGGGSGVFTVEFYDDDTGALLASFEGPLSVSPGGESDPFAVDIGAMPAKAWIIRCEITP